MPFLDGKYPFLDTSPIVDSVHPHLRTSLGSIALRAAVTRILVACGVSQKDTRYLSAPTDEFSNAVSILSYKLALVLTSCLEDVSIYDKISAHEADRVHRLSENELCEEIYLGISCGIDIQSTGIPVTKYIPLVTKFHDARWKLVNQPVESGMVVLDDESMRALLREAIRIHIRASLPLEVPEDIKILLEEPLEKLRSSVAKKTTRVYGAIDESAFPPCIKKLIADLSKGVNLTHPGRFALTTFLFEVGFKPEQIIKMYQPSPDYNYSMTEYQVRHITGGYGKAYKVPACDTMKTTGLCIRNGTDCYGSHHPLRYYTYIQKARLEKDWWKIGAKVRDHARVREAHRFNFHRGLLDIGMKIGEFVEEEEESRVIIQNRLKKESEK